MRTFRRWGADGASVPPTRPLSRGYAGLMSRIRATSLVRVLAVLCALAVAVPAVVVAKRYVGTSKADRITGGSADDTVEASYGNDVIRTVHSVGYAVEDSVRA